MNITSLSTVLLSFLFCWISFDRACGQGSLAVAHSSTELSLLLRNSSVGQIVLDPSGQSVGGGTLVLDPKHWSQPVFLQRRQVVLRSVAGNVTTLDLQQLPWLVVIGNGSTLELRDLVVTNIAPRRLASNTSYFYAGGLFAWPSLTAQPGCALNSYNTQLFCWSSSRFRRGDCDWLHAGPARDAADQALVPGSPGRTMASEKGVTVIRDDGMYQADLTLRRFSDADVGTMEVNSEGSAFVCVPDSGTADAVATALSAPVPASTDPPAGGPSRASVIGLAVGVAAAGAALLMLALLAAVYVVLRARGGSRSGSQKRTLLGAAAMQASSSPRSGLKKVEEEEASGGGTPKKGPCALGQLQRCGLTKGPLEGLSVDMRLVENEDGTLRKLGEGAYGQVFLGRWHGALVAVKVLRSGLGSAAEQNLRTEVCVLRALRFPNVLTFLSAYVNCMPMMLVTEYCAGGDLGRALLLDQGKPRRFAWAARGGAICLGIARGLSYLHSMEVLHADIKPGNIFLDKSHTVAKIADYGLSKCLQNSVSTHTFRGTVSYMCPQMLSGGVVSYFCDIFSFGVVLQEVVTGDVCEGRRPLREPRAPEDCPQAVVDLWRECVQADPAKRPVASDLVTRLEPLVIHKFLSGKAQSA